MSGHIEFDSSGYRTNVSMAVVDMANDDSVDLVSAFVAVGSANPLNLLCLLVYLRLAFGTSSPS